MPPRTARKTSYRRRYPRRQVYRRSGQQWGVQMPRQLMLQPDKIRRRLRFSIDDGDCHEISSTTGSVGDWVYRANSIYDCYAGAGGDHARGFNEYMALYQHFVVVGSQAVMKFTYPTSAVTNVPGRMAVILRDSATAISTTAGIGESHRACVKTLGPVAGLITCVMKFSSRKFFSTRARFDNEELHGSSASAPSTQAYFHVCGFAMNNATQTFLVGGYIDYIVDFFDTIMPNQSTGS